MTAGPRRRPAGEFASSWRRVASLALAGLALTAAMDVAAQDKAAERLVRRLQLQLQAAQTQLAEVQAAKSKAEADKSLVERQLAEQSQQLGGLKGSLGKSAAGLRAAESERGALAGHLAALKAAHEKQTTELKRGLDEQLAAKDKELAQSGQQRQAQLAAAQKLREEQSVQIADCSAKNERLVQLGAELLQKYRGKTVADVLKQQDPVLGLGDVQMFNLIQEHRDKTDAERYVSPSPR